MIDMNEVVKKMTTISIKPYKKGQWICKWGLDSEEGIVGIGEVPTAAVINFCKNVLAKTS